MTKAQQDMVFFAASMLKRVRAAVVIVHGAVLDGDEAQTSATSSALNDCLMHVDASLSDLAALGEA